MQVERELPIVTHLTQIVFHLTPMREEMEEAGLWRGTIDAGQVRKAGQLMHQRTERIAGMMDLLAAQGFSFEVKKSIIYAFSNEVEAFEAKHSLLEAGFKDREFQIVLEYTRGWGML